MKKLGIVGGVILGLLVPVIGGLLGVLFGVFPKVGPAPERTVSATPEQIERGRLLAWHYAGCIDCHSERDYTRYSAPIVPGTEGMGGESFSGDLGVLHASNITPAALGDWTDGELYWAITAGVDRDGAPLFPIMPYVNYGQLPDEDIDAIIAYVRTLEPIEHEVPERELAFPLPLIVRTIPREPEPLPRPPRSDAAAYGEYIARMGGCADCHTQAEMGEPLPGMEYAGGFELPMPDGTTIRSSNITPDLETGIGAWNETLFVARFRSMAPPEGPYPVAAGQPNTMMPWSLYAGMSEEDLQALFVYLQTVEPVSYDVEASAE